MIRPVTTAELPRPCLPGICPYDSRGLEPGRPAGRPTDSSGLGVSLAGQPDALRLQAAAR